MFYIGQGPFLSSPGDWSIVLNIRVITGNDLRLSYNLDVPDPLGTAGAPRTEPATTEPATEPVPRASGSRPAQPIANPPNGNPGALSSLPGVGDRLVQ